jgi:hypothetical protein
MKETVDNNKRKPLLAVLLVVLGIFAFHVQATEVVYDVDWPVIHLDGTFTLEVRSDFGTYFSTAAAGSYGGANGSFDVVWTSVKFDCRPDFAELTFIWNQGYTGYAVSPSYVGRPSPWTSADEAWQDLIAKGKADGVYIALRDTTPPQIVTIATTPIRLWPPNHRMIPVSVRVDVLDELDPSPTVHITEVRSNEPQIGFEPDWEITGPLSLNLRAERFGSKVARIYTIVVKCEDASGNVAYASVEVAVAHDHR